jgi:hypothetical protein
MCMMFGLHRTLASHHVRSPRHYAITVIAITIRQYARLAHRGRCQLCELGLPMIMLTTCRVPANVRVDLVPAPDPARPQTASDLHSGNRRGLAAAHVARNPSASAIQAQP